MPKISVIHVCLKFSPVGKEGGHDGPAALAHDHQALKQVGQQGTAAHQIELSGESQQVTSKDMYVSIYVKLMFSFSFLF